jgi:hypothetical protein
LGAVVVVFGFSVSVVFGAVFVWVGVDVGRGRGGVVVDELLFWESAVAAKDSNNKTGRTNLVVIDLAPYSLKITLGRASVRLEMTIGQSGRELSQV